MILGVIAVFKILCLIEPDFVTFVNASSFSVIAVVINIIHLILMVCLFSDLQSVKKKDKSVVMVFLKESNLISVVMLFIGLVIICWLTYILFVKRSLLVSGSLIMGMMALTCEGRDILIAVIKGLKAKNKNNKFVKTALLKEND